MIILQSALVEAQLDSLLREIQVQPHTEQGWLLLWEVEGILSILPYTWAERYQRRLAEAHQSQFPPPRYHYADLSPQSVIESGE